MPKGEAWQAPWKPHRIVLVFVEGVLCSSSRYSTDRAYLQPRVNILEVSVLWQARPKALSATWCIKMAL